MVRISSLFCLLTVLCLGQVNSSFFKTHKHADNLDRDISDLHASMLFPTDDIRSSHHSDLQAPAFECSQGSDPADMTAADYLAAFRSSDCSPAIFLPGITASKLHVEIDCPVLRLSHPE